MTAKTGSNRQMKVLHTQIYKSTLHEGKHWGWLGNMLKRLVKKKKNKSMKVTNSN